MTEDEAMHAIGRLAGGLNGFTVKAVAEYVRECMTLDDAEALDDVCRELATTWTGEFKPALPVVLAQYRAHPRVTAEREARTAAALAKTAIGNHCTGDGWIDVIEADGGRRPRPCPRCNPNLAEIYADPDKWAKWRAGTHANDLIDPEIAKLPAPPSCKIDTIHDPDYRVPRHDEGQTIAADEYRSRYGRDIGAAATPNPGFAEQVIIDAGRFDPAKEVWFSTFSEVADAFGGDFHRARVSLEALGPRIVRDMRGGLVLKPPPDEPVASLQPRTSPPVVEGGIETPPPSERPPDATGLLAEALGETRRRMEEP